MVCTNILLVAPWSCWTVPQQVLDAPPTFLPGHWECMVSGYNSIFGQIPVQAQLQKAQGEFEDFASEKFFFTTVCRHSREQISSSGTHLLVFHFTVSFTEMSHFACDMGGL